MFILFCPFYLTVKVMVDLTDEQKDECQRVINALASYWWARLRIKMDVDGLSFEDAVAEIKAEIYNG